MAYLTLCTISLGLEYYSDRQARGLSLVPFPETDRIMKNYHLLLKNKDSEWYVKQEYKAEKEPYIAIEKELKLVFGVSNSDPYFQSKIALPDFRPSKQKFVVDAKGNLEVMDFAIGNYKFTPAESGVYRWLQGADEFGFELEEYIQASLPVNNYGVWLLTTPSGQQRKVYCGGSDFNFDGIVEVVTNGQEQQVIIDFPASELSWEYVVVSKYGRDLDAVLLRDDAGLIDFDRRNAVYKNMPAVRFSSNTPIKLSDRYPYFLSLEYRGEIIKKVVPFPSLKNLSRCEKDVDKFNLETFINI